MNPTVIKTRAIQRGPINSLQRNNFFNQVLHDIHKITVTVNENTESIKDNLSYQLALINDLQSKAVAIEKQAARLLSALQEG